MSDEDSSDLAVDAVVPLLRGRLGRPYLFVSECESTQNLARAGDPDEGAVVAADHQLAGRGRSGRTWEDAPGDGLLFSLVLRPPQSPQLPQLSLVVALAVAEAIEEAVGIAAGVKWPNDVEIDGRKVAGILLEASAGIVVCGLGINVNQTAERLPRSTRRPAGSLRSATGRRHDRAALLATVLAGVEHRYDEWRQLGLAVVAGSLNRRSVLNGRSVRVGDREGIVERITATGVLELRTGAGTIAVDSGEVEVLDVPLLS